MTRSLLLRYRLSLSLFVIGLIFSGLTAFPLQTELQILCRLFGVDDPTRYAELSGLQHWIGFVAFGLEQTYARFPFVGYGTDWLAFGHLCLAVFFIRPLFRPHESDWVLRGGLVCCAGVIPLAMIAGQIRGIPFYWRLIDCSFGVIGALPLLYCLRLSREMKRLPAGA